MRRIYETETITIGESHLPRTIEITIYDQDSGNAVTALVSQENWREVTKVVDSYGSLFTWAEPEKIVGLAIDGSEQTFTRED